MSRRAYDYATPIFGGGFCCVPPPPQMERSRPEAAYRSLQKQNSILQSSLNRTDSSGSSRGQLSRMESLSSRGQLSRGNSTTSRTESYSTTSTGTGGPTSFSSTTYTSPYGNTYRTSSKF